MRKSSTASAACQAEFVGHPLADLPPPSIGREQFAAENGLDAEKIWIGLLPGSRLKEIEANLPEMLEAAWDLHSPEPAGDIPEETYEFLIPLAPTLDAAQRKVVAQIAEKLAGGLPVRLVNDSARSGAAARAALFHARASVVASGTATVEAALIGNPFVVVYRVSPITYAIARRLVKVPHVAMVNLIAGKRMVPELIQHDLTAANIVQHLRQLLPDGPARQSMMKELGAIRQALHLPKAAGYARDSSTIDTVAAIVSAELEAATPAVFRSGGAVENSPG